MPSMRRSIWFWLCFGVAILLAVYFASRIIMVGTGHGAMARLHKTFIIADVENKDMTALSAAASLPKNTSFYSINLKDMNNNILSVPGVKNSAVRRLPNGNLVIHVSFHHFVASWTDGENYFPLSDDGTIANKPSPERPTSAVLFRGPVPDNITKITNAANDMLADIDYIEWIENRRWDIHTNGGIVIKLPEDDFAYAIASLITINKNHNIFGRDISVIDMRDPARILVR